MDTLAFIRKKLQPFYYSHCLTKSSCINIEGFMSFCREFALFPYFISRGKLMQIFYGLASLYPLVSVKKDNINNAQVLSTIRKGDLEIQKRDIIDENLFIETIPMCAAEIEEGDERHTLDKVLFLVS